ncbi:MAG: hypothetical protein U0791_12325 [Gemmataceae bacterium]
MLGTWPTISRRRPRPLQVANPDELRELAGLFHKVVNDGMVDQVRRLPEHALTPAQKKDLYQRLSDKLQDGAGQPGPDDAAKGVAAPRPTRP